MTHPTDATEQAAGSGEGVKKKRKDGDRDAGAGDDDASGKVQSDSMLPPRGEQEVSAAFSSCS